MISWLGLLEASASGGICIILFFFILQLCGEKYPAKYKKVVWFLIALRLCIPVSFSLLPQPLTVQVPVYVLDERENSNMAGNANDSFVDGIDKMSGVSNSESSNSEVSNGGTYNDGTLNSGISNDEAFTAEGVNDNEGRTASQITNRRITSQSILIALWCCGCVVVILYYLMGHIIFYRRMMQKSENCTNKKILATTIRMSYELGLKKVPEIRLTSDDQTGPYTIGFSAIS